MTMTYKQQQYIKPALIFNTDMTLTYCLYHYMNQNKAI